MSVAYHERQAGSVQPGAVPVGLCDRRVIDPGLPGYFDRRHRDDQLAGLKPAVVRLDLCVELGIGAVRALRVSRWIQSSKENVS